MKESLAVQFQVNLHGAGKTQVQTIVKEREDILRGWESGERSDKQKVRKALNGRL